MAGGMRQRPVDMVACPVCPEKHEAMARVAGWPILVCPKVRGNAMHFEAGWQAFVVGEPKP